MTMNSQNKCNHCYQKVIHYRSAMIGLCLLTYTPILAFFRVVQNIGIKFLRVVLVTRHCERV